MTAAEIFDQQTIIPPEATGEPTPSDEPTPSAPISCPPDPALPDPDGPDDPDSPISLSTKPSGNDATTASRPTRKSINWRHTRPWRKNPMSLSSTPQHHPFAPASYNGNTHTH